MNLSKNVEGSPSLISVKELLPLVQQRANTKFDYRAIWKKLTSEQKEQVAEMVEEERDLKIYNHLFSAFDAKNIPAAYREQETIKRHTHALKVDGYLTPEQAERISVLVEFALLNWLDEINDYSNKFLADIRNAITITESDNNFDSAWTFDNIEFYLQLGLVSQDALKKALSLVVEAGNRAHQFDRKDLVEEFQVLAQILTDWDTTKPQPLTPQTESWFAKQRRSLLEKKYQMSIKGTLLDLRYSVFSTLQNEIDFFSNHTYLTQIDLSDCSRLVDLPESIGNLTNLTQLKLYCSKSLISLPESIGNLINLTKLDLALCHSLNSLPEDIGKLTNLTKLDLFGCRSLTNLPEGLSNLAKLIQLDLRDCTNLRNLPESIGKLTNLLQLNLEGCRALTDLPESIGNLTNLTHINLSNCTSLTSLPESVGKLTNLVQLDLSNCFDLTSLPESIHRLENLTLNLDGCGSSKEKRKFLQQMRSSRNIRNAAG